MKLNTRKELHMTHWDLICALIKAGLADDDACGQVEINLIPKTEVNQGRVIVISWDKMEQEVKLEKSND